MNLKRLVLFLFLLIAACGISVANSRYTLSNSRLYRVYCQAVIKNSGGPASNVKVHFPVFATQNLPPYQELISVSANPSNIKLYQKNGEQYVDYVIPKLNRESYTLEITYIFNNWAIEYNQSAYYGSFEIEQRYLNPEQGIESDSPPIIAQARALVARNDTMVDKSKKIFRFVNDHLTYDSRIVSEHSALKTLGSRTGACEDYSLLYIALCRAVGVPARFVSGYRFEPKEVNGSEVDLTPFGHAWAEVYLPMTGWVTVEPTFMYSINGEKTVNYDFFGKISAEDRHLFCNYAHLTSADSTWEYNPKNPPKIDISYQYRVRGL